MGKIVGIVDYGVGNLFSVGNAVQSLSCEKIISGSPDQLSEVDCIIFPGVGAFDDGMEKLRKRGLDRFLIEYAESGKPILGICLGMQLLLSEGSEGGVSKGLNLIEGSVMKLPYATGCKIPHIGWNDVFGESMSVNPVFSGVEQNTSFYFVHSYHVLPDADISLVYTDFYGQDIVAGFHADNLYGVQFHPEKSQKAGMQLLNNFIAIEV